MQNEFERFYQQHLTAHGDSAQGVGWKNAEAQRIRFEQLIKVINTNQSFSINDLGCGVGDLISFLDLYKQDYKYDGYDVMPKMIERAKERFQTCSYARFENITRAGEMKSADFTVASGIFNIKFDQSNELWLKYIHETITIMNEKSKDGFSFNVLTKYSDVEFMKAELYYADPGASFDFCKKNFSKNVALLHDYNQYDFTIIVRKNL